MSPADGASTRPSLTITRRSPALVFVLALLAAFVALLAAAVLAYPGGSWADATAPGFDPLRNVWCDLMRSEAVDGSPNGLARRLAQAAFTALALALGPFFGLAARLVPEGRTRGAVRLAGGASALFVLLTAALPYDGYRPAHSAATLAAGSLGFVATLLVALRRTRERDLLPLVLDAAVVLAFVTNIAVYAPLVLDGGGDGAALPIVQKAGTLLLVAWMVVVARAGARQGVA
ncbi:MAG: DUF998 domain-containing protein [Planctomycetes bacterium]|nr:DUF998 domain-containing protein [Planctomycetota bacterium]